MRGNDRIITECLSCGEDISIVRKQKLGEMITCKHCGNQFIVVELEPLLIDWPDYDAYYGEDDDPYDEFEPYDDFSQGDEYGLMGQREITT